mgnify:CR=1 FL=1
MKQEDLIGKLTKEGSLLIWELPNSIILKISINASPHEGYIGTSYLKNGKEVILTHWHPMEDEIYKDLMDINNGQIIWVKKRSILGERVIIMDKKEYETMSERQKSKYEQFHKLLSR